MVICQMPDGSSGDPGLCSGDDKPPSKQICVLKPCGYAVWNTTTWSEVSG